MTPLQWAVLDELAERPESLPIPASVIATYLQPRGFDVDATKVGGALAVLRKQGLARKKSIPTGQTIFVRGRMVRQFETVWSINPKAEIPTRQETML